MLALPKGSADISRAIRPLWTKEDVSTYQNLFGATWAEKTIVAAFDSTILQPDIEIVAVYRTMPKFGGGPSKRELRGVIFDKIETSK